MARALPFQCMCVFRAAVVLVLWLQRGHSQAGCTLLLTTPLPKGCGRQHFISSFALTILPNMKTWGQSKQDHQRVMVDPMLLIV